MAERRAPSILSVKAPLREEFRPSWPDFSPPVIDVFSGELPAWPPPSREPELSLGPSDLLSFFSIADSLFPLFGAIPCEVLDDSVTAELERDIVTLVPEGTTDNLCGNEMMWNPVQRPNNSSESD